MKQLSFHNIFLYVEELTRCDSSDELIIGLAILNLLGHVAVSFSCKI